MNKKIGNYSGNILRVSIIFSKSSIARYNSLIKAIAPDNLVPNPNPSVRLLTQIPIIQRQACEDVFSGLARNLPPFPVYLFNPGKIDRPKYVHVVLRASSPALSDIIRPRLTAYLGHESLMAERAALGLKESNLNWSLGRNQIFSAFEKLSEDEARRMKEALLKIFPVEDPYLNIPEARQIHIRPTVLDAIGFRLRETRVFDPEGTTGVVPDKDFLFAYEEMNGYQDKVGPADGVDERGGVPWHGESA